MINCHHADSFIHSLLLNLTFVSQIYRYSTSITLVCIIYKVYSYSLFIAARLTRLNSSENTCQEMSSLPYPSTTYNSRTIFLCLVVVESKSSQSDKNISIVCHTSVSISSIFFLSVFRFPFLAKLLISSFNLLNFWMNQMIKSQV